MQIGYRKSTEICWIIAAGRLNTTNAKLKSRRNQNWFLSRAGFSRINLVDATRSIFQYYSIQFESIRLGYYGVGHEFTNETMVCATSFYVHNESWIISFFLCTICIDATFRNVHFTSFRSSSVTSNQFGARAKQLWHWNATWGDWLFKPTAISVFFSFDILVRLGFPIFDGRYTFSDWLTHMC